MKKTDLKIITMVIVAFAVLILTGCRGNAFEPDLTDTEWLGYRVGSDGKYITSTEYVFSQDRIKYLDKDEEYSLHTGTEAYTEAYITEEDAEALYTEDTFDGDERGGFVTIITHYEDGGKDGLYGWMNKSMDKMELTDPYDGARCYLFRKDTDAVSSYEKKVEPLFNAFIKDNLGEGDGFDVVYADRVLTFDGSLESLDGATEQTVKKPVILDTIEKSLDDYASQGPELAGSLESMLCLDGIRVRLDFTFNGEIIGSATYDKSGEIKEERFLYGQ